MEVNEDNVKQNYSVKLLNWELDLQKDTHKTRQIFHHYDKRSLLLTPGS